MAEISLHLLNDERGQTYMLGVSRPLSAKRGTRLPILWWAWTGFEFYTFKSIEGRAAGFSAVAAGRLRG